MNPGERPAHQIHAAKAARRIDTICDDFERRLRNGENRRVEDCLSDVEDAMRPELLRQLLLLEWDYRQQRGEDIPLSEAGRRFADYAEIVHEAALEHERAMTRQADAFDSTGAPRSFAPSAMLSWKELGYELLGRLGIGGSSTVYLAMETAHGRMVALKTLAAEADSNSAGLARFRREVRTLSRLQHPHIVCVFESGRHGARAWYSMEYCSGGSLSDYLAHSRLSARAAAALVETLAGAVHFAHEAQVIHRDLKPSNVLLQRRNLPHAEFTGREHHQLHDMPPDGEVSSRAFVPKLADFGLVRLLGEDTQTRTGALLGTPQYMAPEQVRGDSQSVGAAVDIYALGAILYECLTGQPPFEGKTLVNVLRKVIEQEEPSLRGKARVPRDLATICQKCLRHDPQARYETAADLAADLRRFLHGQPIVARPVTVIERFWKQLRPYLTAPRFAASAVLAVAVIGLIHGSLRTHKAPDSSTTPVAETPTGTDRRVIDVELRLARAHYAMALDAAAESDPQTAILLLARSLRSAVSAADGQLEESIRLQLGVMRHQLRALKQIYPHESKIYSVALSADGSQIVTCSADQTARVWEAATGRPVVPPLQHADDVYCAAFSPDGRSIVTGSGDGAVQVWESTTGKPVGAPSRHDDRVLAVTFSPDGQVVLTGSDDATARLWDTATREPFGEPITHPDTVRCVAFSPDGRTFVTGCDDGRARLWQTATGRLVLEGFRHQKRLFGVAFSPTGELILTCSDDATARLWKAATAEPVGLPMEHQDGVIAGAFSPDSGVVMTSGDDDSARFWDGRTGEPLTGQLRHFANVRGAAFGPDGRTVLTSCFDGVARLWESGLPIPFPACYTLRDVFFDRKNGTVVTCSTRYVKTWDSTTGVLVGSPRWLEPRASAAAFSPDGRTLLVGHIDGTARLTETASGREFGSTLRHKKTVISACFSPDGQLVLTGSEDGTLRLWDAKSGQPKSSSLPGSHGLTSVAFAPDGRSFLTARYDAQFNVNVTAGLWDTKTCQLRASLQHLHTIHAAAFSPDGRMAVTAGWNGEVRLWDVSTGRQLRQLPQQTTHIYAAAFSPDGRVLITGNFDHTLRFWRVADGAPLGAPVQHTSRIDHLWCSPDDGTILTYCRDRNTQLCRAVQPMNGTPEEVFARCQVMTGMTVNEQGSVRTFDPAAWKALRQKLAGD